MIFRRAELSINTTVYFILAFIILFVLFAGFGPLNQVIFGANQIPDFNSSQPISGVSLLAIDLNNNAILQYHNGEEWETISTEKDYYFTLGSYTFNPSKVRDALYNFYANTDRRPSSFQISVNDWRYWGVSFSKPTQIYEPIRVKIDSLTKSGFADSEFKNSAFLDINNNFVYSSGNSADKIFSSEKNYPSYQTSIAWRDSILQGKSCEKYLSLSLSLPKSDGVPKEFLYTVRRDYQYLFIDLDNYVLDSSNEKWKKIDCFKVEEYDDTLIDRSDWINDAIVQINFIDNDALLGKDTSSKIWWFPYGGVNSIGWAYQSSKSNWESVFLNSENLVASNSKYDIPIKYYLDGYSSFYKGLLELSAVRSSKDVAVFNNKDEAYDIHVFIKSKDVEKEVNLEEILVTNTDPLIDTSRGLNNDGTVSNNFVYAILNEYNKHLMPNFYFENGDDGIKRLYKMETFTDSISSVYTYVYLKDNFLYYSIVTKSGENLPVLGDSYVIGSIENDLFFVSDIPTFEQLSMSYPNIEKINYDLTLEGINYLRNKNVEYISVKESS